MAEGSNGGGRRAVLYRSAEHGRLRAFVDAAISQRVNALAGGHYAQRGHRMAIFANDHIGIEINQYGAYEGMGLDVLFGFLEPIADELRSGLALDIGANIGNHALRFSRHFRHVHAFEPNPLTYSLLELNARWSPNGNIDSHRFGIGHLNQELELMDNPTNSGGASVIPNENNVVEPVTIQIRRLDDLDLDLTDLAFIKLDVEGFEPNVLQGGLSTLEQRQPIVVFEQHQHDFSADGDSTETIRILSELGYAICWQQSGPDSNRWLVRRLANVKEIVAGRPHRVLFDRTVPPNYYSMLIAVPPRFSDALGLRPDRLGQTS